MKKDDSLLTVDLNSSFGSGFRIKNGMDQNSKMELTG